MHDIDRAMFEAADEMGGLPVGGYEAASQHEAYEVAAAAELLDVASEEELEEFLGNLVRKAASAAKGFVSSPTGQALTGLLRNAAKQVLPQAGRMIGGDLGRRAGNWLGSTFETEGLSGEDRDLEVARSLVRIADEATRTAISAGPAAPPVRTAVGALVTAANRNLPALAPVFEVAAGSTPATARTGTVRPATGRWVRRGRTIVVLGL
jgi:hypothetical protein